VCGRFSSGGDSETLHERFKVAVPAERAERFNLAPAQRALIVRSEGGEREAALARWGLLPHWAKDVRIAYKLINARAETLTEKPAFRSLLRGHRCLIVADGFYEWRPAADGKKDPVYFQLAEGVPFAFAGLWTRKVDEESGEPLDSCTIVTTSANALVAPVHDRMPVILPASLEDEWLDPDSSKEHALSLLRPLPAELMTSRVVSRLVNSVRNDDRSLLLPAAALAA
jgi:putative SOS response-associated peptidase YedK